MWVVSKTSNLYISAPSPPRPPPPFFLLTNGFKSETSVGITAVKRLQENGWKTDDL